MLRALIVSVFLVLTSLPATAQEPGLIVRQSSFSVAETLDRLAALAQERGINVAARVDHAAAAGTVEMELRPIQVLIFGNPRLGTPLMQSNPTIGIDLPLKVLAWEDADGVVNVAYNDPAFLRGRHAIDDRDESFEAMANALDALTAAATTP